MEGRRDSSGETPLKRAYADALLDAQRRRRTWAMHALAEDRARWNMVLLTRALTDEERAERDATDDELRGRSQPG